MYPDPLFSILGVQIYFYVVAYGVGFVLAFMLALILTREQYARHPLKDLIAVSAACIVADLAFTPILVWVIRQFNLWLPFNWSLGQIIAVFTGLATYHVIVRQRMPISFSQRLDIFASPMMLFIIIVRVACLAAGCCYGTPAPDLPWAITFTNPRAISIYQNIPVHPTQLYEAIGALAILGIVLALRRRAEWRGKLMWLALLLYAGMRFVIEFYRGDPRPMIDVLSLNQIVCVALAIVCGSILAWKFNFSLPTSAK